MSHIVNPSGFRVGKSFLWSHNSLINNANKQKAFNNTINTSIGLEETINGIIQRNNYIVVKSSLKVNNLGTPQLKILYYPIMAPIERNKVFPRYCALKRTLNTPKNYNIKFKQLLSKIWQVKKREFNNRFVRTQRRKNLNEWLTRMMFDGTKTQVRYYKTKKVLVNKNIKTKLSKLQQKQINANWQSKFIKKIKRRKKRKLKLNGKKLTIRYVHRRWHRWGITKTFKLSNKRLSKQLSKRIGMRVQVITKNIFSYFIRKKRKKFPAKTHQLHIWNPEYHRYKWQYSSYYDIVNSLLILSKVPYTENLVTKLIRYGLINMHKRKLKPKPFFYFLSAVLKNMIDLQYNFNAVRAIITGKLQGGTGRTKTFNIGFGLIPSQSISKNVRYSFENLHSKYGSFGIKFITWRKTRRERKNKRIEYLIERFKLIKDTIRPKRKKYKKKKYEFFKKLWHKQQPNSIRPKRLHYNRGINKSQKQTKSITKLLHNKPKTRRKVNSSVFKNA